MSKDKLIEIEEGGGWVVAWLVTLEGGGGEEDVGAWLGDYGTRSRGFSHLDARVDARIETAKTESDFDELEQDVASRAAEGALKLEHPDSYDRISGGLVFHRRSVATKVRRAATAAVKGLRAKAKAVLKATPEATWPLWAITAKAAGWKAPKGWKP